MLQPITKFRGEIFAGGPNTMKFMKVFSLQSFCYTIVGYSDMDLGLHSHLPIFASSCVTTNSVPLVMLLLSLTSILIQGAHSSSGGRDCRGILHLLEGRISPSSGESTHENSSCAVSHQCTVVDYE